jgi:hypothetical protein
MPQMSKVSKNNTCVGRDGKKITITLHNTQVVSFDDKKIILDHGGWVTTTTAARMNQASNEFNLGYYVSRKAGEMYVTFNGLKHQFSPRIILTR